MPTTSNKTEVNIEMEAEVVEEKEEEEEKDEKKKKILIKFNNPYLTSKK